MVGGRKPKDIASLTAVLRAIWRALTDLQKQLAELVKM
jgi:hypothetical protein